MARLKVEHLYKYGLPFLWEYQVTLWKVNKSRKLGDKYEEKQKIASNKELTAALFTRSLAMNILTEEE